MPAKPQAIGEAAAKPTRITPELAGKLLRDDREALPGGHASKESLIAEYAASMLRGEWVEPNPRAPIVIAGPEGWSWNGVRMEPGTIHDGLHRLNAIAMSGVTVPQYVEWKTDQGRVPVVLPE